MKPEPPVTRTVVEEGVDIGEIDREESVWKIESVQSKSSRRRKNWSVFSYQALVRKGRPIIPLRFCAKILATIYKYLVLDCLDNHNSIKIPTVKLYRESLGIIRFMRAWTFREVVLVKRATVVYKRQAINVLTPLVSS